MDIDFCMNAATNLCWEIARRLKSILLYKRLDFVKFEYDYDDDDDDSDGDKNSKYSTSQLREPIMR